jgi:SpoVK/Ycf46/Vps4 family AAA+-type ATPase
LPEHLFEHVRPVLSAPRAERIAFIRAPRWIGADPALAAHRRLQALLERPPALRTEGLMLLGPYANGKTMIAERFVLQHLGSAAQRKAWIVQTREGAGLAHFYASVIAGLGAPASGLRSVARLAEQVDALFRQLRPRILIFDEFHNALRGRSRDVEAIFAFLRRLGREYDVSPVLIGEVAVYDHVNATSEMASRFQALPVPRWRYGETYLALLDTLEAALPLAHPSELSQETLARRVFAFSEGLIGETVRIVTEAVLVAIDDGAERITPRTLDALDYIPLSERRRTVLRQELL